MAPMIWGEGLHVAWMLTKLTWSTWYGRVDRLKRSLISNYLCMQLYSWPACCFQAQTFRKSECLVMSCPSILSLSISIRSWQRPVLYLPVGYFVLISIILVCVCECVCGCVCVCVYVCVCVCVCVCVSVCVGVCVGVGVCVTATPHTCIVERKVYANPRLSIQHTCLHVHHNFSRLPSPNHLLFFSLISTMAGKHRSTNRFSSLTFVSTPYPSKLSQKRAFS